MVEEARVLGQEGGGGEMTMDDSFWGGQEGKGEEGIIKKYNAKHTH